MKLDITVYILAFAIYVSAQTDKACFGNGGVVGAVDDDPNMSNLQQLIEEFDEDKRLQQIMGCENLPSNTLANL